MQQSNKHKLHYQLLAQCLYLTCNTMLLHVSATHFGHLQGATNLMYVNSVCGNLLQMFGTHTNTHTHTHAYIYINIIHL
jgi:hypothetical protein